MKSARPCHGPECIQLGPVLTSPILSSCLVEERITGHRYGEHGVIRERTDQPPWNYSMQVPGGSALVSSKKATPWADMR